MNRYKFISDLCRALHLATNGRTGRVVHFLSQAVTSCRGSSMVRLDRALPPGAHAFVDLGNVREIADADIHGMSVCAAWKRPCRVQIIGHGPSGRDRVRVRVTNPRLNGMLGPQPPDCSQLRTRFSARLPGPVRVLIRGGTQP